MARPRKSPNERASVVVSFRCTQSEVGVLDEIAKTLSDSLCMRITRGHVAKAITFKSIKDNPNPILEV